MHKNYTKIVYFPPPIVFSFHIPQIVHLPVQVVLISVHRGPLPCTRNMLQLCRRGLYKYSLILQFKLQNFSITDSVPEQVSVLSCKMSITLEKYFFEGCLQIFDNKLLGDKQNNDIRRVALYAANPQHPTVTAENTILLLIWWPVCGDALLTQTTLCWNIQTKQWDFWWFVADIGKRHASH